MSARRFAPIETSVALIVLLLVPAPAVGAEGDRPTPAEPVIERLANDQVRVDRITVDVKKREVSVAGVVNDVTVLEFVANTRGGAKAYESALELDTSAAAFNLALLLIGLDKSRAVVPRAHFDPRPPEGDPVEIWVEWQDQGRPRKVRAEELVYNSQRQETLRAGPWVYTGSAFTRHGYYLAEVQGVLIGFVHTPAPIIENPLPDAVGNYGHFRLNPNLGLRPRTAVKLTVRALPSHSGPASAPRDPGSKEQIR